jgi:LuxR family maltose regulon positive regulatory protein
MPGRVVARPRLFELLDQGVQGPVTLVAAPAGSGKTLLLASWAAQASAPGPVAWLSLDPADNDPGRCWSYVLAALGGAGALPAGDQPPDPPPGAAADDGGPPAPLVQALGELASPVVLVLDDLHELTDPGSCGGWSSWSATPRPTFGWCWSPGPTRPCRCTGCSSPAS